MTDADQLLNMQPLPMLWDLRTPAADRAVRRRCVAFHEAGHVWAAHRSLLRPERASTINQGPAFLGRDRDATTRIAATGFLVQALLIDADLERMKCGLPLGTPGLLDDDPGSIDLVDLQTSVTVMRGAPAPCRRGGDLLAVSSLTDQNWLTGELTPVLADWPTIETLAEALLIIGDLSRADIDRVMTSGAR